MEIKDRNKVAIIEYVTADVGFHDADDGYLYIWMEIVTIKVVSQSTV